MPGTSRFAARAGVWFPPPMSTAGKSSLRPRLPVRTKLYTYDELCAQMEETNQPHELWDGELIMAPSPFFSHQNVVFRFARLLEAWCSSRKLGTVVVSPIDMVLSPRRMVQPDVAFVASARREIIRDVIRGPADLVAEVVSPGGRRRDRSEKKDLYEQHGVKEYWIIDPEGCSVDVLHLNPHRQYDLAGRYLAGETAASVLLPGFTIELDALMAEGGD